MASDALKPELPNSYLWANMWMQGIQPKSSGREPVLLTDKPSLWTPQRKNPKIYNSTIKQLRLSVPSSPDPYNPSPTMAYT